MFYTPRGIWPVEKKQERKKHKSSIAESTKIYFSVEPKLE